MPIIDKSVYFILMPKIKNPYKFISLMDALNLAGKELVNAHVLDGKVLT